jgi:hypothetical protein
VVAIALALFAGAVALRTRTGAGAAASAPAPPLGPAPAPVPALEIAGVAPGPRSGLDFGRPVTVTVRVPAAIAGDPGPGLRVRLVARDGDQAVTPPVEQAVEAGASAALVFTVAGPAPVRVDALDLSVLAAGRTDPVAARREPVVLAFGPPIPGPPRCTGYDPAALRIGSLGAPGWALTAGATLAVLDTEDDARRALAVAAGSDRRCVIGPDPPTGPGLATTHYWMRGGDLTMPPAEPGPDEDCHRYDPVAVSVVEGAQLVAGDAAVPLLILRDDAEALQAAAVARRYRWQCFVGRDNGRGDAAYRLDYWRG